MKNSEKPTLIAMTVSRQGSMDEDLPDIEGAKEFYAKYDVKEVLGR